MNLVILSGRLGADIDVKTSNSTTYCHFSLASNYRVQVDGEYEDRVTWTRVTAFNGLAKSLGTLGKGSLIELRGHLKTTGFEEGDVRLQYSEVIADRVDFLHFKEQGAGDSEAPSEEPATEAA